MKLGEWPPTEEKETDKPHIVNSGACTAGYLSGIWASSVAQIREVLALNGNSYGLVFALTGNNNIKHGTDERLIEIGFKEVFQAPNWLHQNVPIKLWAINLTEWRKAIAAVKQPRAVAR